MFSFSGSSWISSLNNLTCFSVICFCNTKNVKKVSDPRQNGTPTGGLVLTSTTTAQRCVSDFEMLSPSIFILFSTFYKLAFIQYFPENIKKNANIFQNGMPLQCWNNFPQEKANTELCLWWKPHNCMPKLLKNHSNRHKHNCEGYSFSSSHKPASSLCMHMVTTPCLINALFWDLVHIFFNCRDLTVKDHLYDTQKHMVACTAYTCTKCTWDVWLDFLSLHRFNIFSRKGVNIKINSSELCIMADEHDELNKTLW